MNPICAQVDQASVLFTVDCRFIASAPTTVVTLPTATRSASEVVRATPRQSDLMIVSGRVAHKMAEPIRQLYEQMLEPKYVMAMGACSSTGGMFSNYSVLQGVDKIVPVDVYVPGCPPRPEAVMEGLMVLQQRIKSGIPSASLQQETQS
jgi:NADH-quinone oxidoreductase subunit B